MKEPLFIQAAYSRNSYRVPIWFMRQAGRYMEEYRKLREKYDILEIATTPELAVQVAMQPIRAFGFDAAIIFADIILPLMHIGIPVKIVGNIGPVVPDPISRASQVKEIRSLDWKRDFGFLSKTIKMLNKELKGTPLIGFSGAPFTLACYLIEGKSSKNFHKTKLMMYREPKLWHALMKKLTVAVSAYLEGQIEGGVQAIQLFDSWAGILSAEDYKTFVLPYSKEIFGSLMKKNVPRIHFGADTFGILADFSSVDCEVVGIDWRVPIKDAKQIAKGKVLQGNLDPSLLFAPLSLIKERIDQIFEEVGNKRGFIFNLGHGIHPDTPREIVSEVVNYVHSKT